MGSGGSGGSSAAGAGPAGGAHTGEPGGDPDSGSSDQRGDVDDVDADALTPEQQARLDSIGRVLDEALRQVRDGEVKPELLEALDMTKDEFAAFIEKYARRYGKIKDMLTRTRRPDGELGGAFSLTGSDRRQAGRGTDAAVGDVTGSEDLSEDQLRKLYESQAGRVSPEYRKSVDDYFRAVSEAGTSDAPTTQPSN